MTELGREIVGLCDDEARARLDELDRLVRSTRRRSRVSTSALTGSEDAAENFDDADDEAWKEALLARLHRLSPSAFEHFCIYLLRQFGLELEHRGGAGDEGVDALGLAPMSPVLSATVAVQVKRNDPASSLISRDTVALFQRDAAAQGAERAVLITLGRFSAPARKAAVSTTPTVDLIDADRLLELIREKEVGIKIQPVVDEGWFDRFES
jgi:restriction system protein